MIRQFVLAFAVALLAVPGGQAAEGSAEGFYTAALARERGLRDPGVSPSLADLRGAITAYESIVERFPTTSYADHALWQAAGLALEAYDRYRQAEDHTAGMRLLDRLEVFHPESPFAARAAERRRQLHALSEVALLASIDRDARGGVVRVTLEFNREVPFRFERLKNPDRVFFDFPRTEAAAPLRNATLTFAGHNDVIGAVRLGRHPGETTRVVVDTADATACRVFSLYEPYRVMVDCDEPVIAPPMERATVVAAGGDDSVRTGRGADALASTPSSYVVGRPSTLVPSPLAGFVSSVLRRAVAPPPTQLAPPLPRATVTPPASDAVSERDQLSLARQLGLRVSRIVIDPGHGGYDPGARSRGLREADIVLDIAYRLERRLLSLPGVEVVLTRRGDEYVPLEARTSLANRVEADLFLSIHANASRNKEARGLETYFLNFSVDPHAERIASRENALGSRTMNDLSSLLQAIAGNSKLDESRAFADTIQRSLALRLQRIDATLPNLGVKQAPFIVLIGARMPSVLTEISFVSNREDAALLATDQYREEVAEALFEGILRYQRSLSPVVQLAQQN